MLLSGALTVAQGQEIEARLYANAPVDYNFVGLGVTQVRTSRFTMNSEQLSYNRTFDAFGQSGKVAIVLPYAQLHGSTTVGNQLVSGSAQGLTDPVIRVAANLYGAPALSEAEFRHYEQDLIIGVNLAAGVPWGAYHSNQLFNVGANRVFLQPGIGASQAAGPWRFELSGGAIFYTDNRSYRGSNVLAQHPVYATTGHVIYNFPSTAWLSTDVTYAAGGQSFVNGRQVSNNQENWLFGATLSMPVTARHAIRLHATEGGTVSPRQRYTMYGIFWQYRWGDGR